MKTLLLPILAATLLPFSAAQAAPGKTFGGFAPKYRFTLVVVDREIVKTVGLSNKKTSKVPNGVPKYSIGDNVKFKIGDKGALQLDEAKIAFREGTDRTNFYSNKAPRAGRNGHVATVKKGPKGKNATSAEVTYYTYKTEGLKLTTHRVTYKLAK